MPHCIMGSRDQCEFPLFFQTPVTHGQSLCTALTAGKCLPLGMCKGTVKESNFVWTQSQYFYWTIQQGTEYTCLENGEIRYSLRHTHIYIYIYTYIFIYLRLYCCNLPLHPLVGRKTFLTKIYKYFSHIHYFQPVQAFDHVTHWCPAPAARAHLVSLDNGTWRHRTWHCPRHWSENKGLRNI